MKSIQKPFYLFSRTVKTPLEFKGSQRDPWILGPPKAGIPLRTPIIRTKGKIITFFSTTISNQFTL